MNSSRAIPICPIACLHTRSISAKYHQKPRQMHVMLRWRSILAVEKPLPRCSVISQWHLGKTFAFCQKSLYLSALSSSGTLTLSLIFSGVEFVNSSSSSSSRALNIRNQMNCDAGEHHQGKEVFSLNGTRMFEVALFQVIKFVREEITRYRWEASKALRYWCSNSRRELIILKAWRKIFVLF